MTNKIFKNIVNVTCTAGSVQVEESGLLKICTEGEWHTLCANDVTWTENNAKSVCRELGCNPNGIITMYLLYVHCM